MISNIVVVASLLAFAYGQCVYSETECQCLEGQSGKTCLRYLSGTEPNMQCEAYACGSGYVCDCKLSPSHPQFFTHICFSMSLKSMDLTLAFVLLSCVRHRLGDV